MTLLKANDIHIAFGDKVIIDKANLKLASRDILVILGTSGSGKSSFLRSLAGLIPKKGEVSFEGKSIQSSRHLVHYIAQYPENFQGTVNEYLQAPWQWKKYRGLERRAVDDYLLALDLSPSILEQSFETLSGGQRKRVQIIRSLSLSPKVLLLDEPFSGLDEENKMAIAALLRKFVENREGACCFSDHANSVDFSNKCLKISNKKLVSCK